MKLLKDHDKFCDDLNDFDDIFGEFGWWDIQQAKKFEVLIKNNEKASAELLDYEK